MKKILLLIISVFYMLSAIGAPYVEHYCMGENMGISLSNEHWEHCPKCGMKNNANKGCCKDVHKTIKASDHHKTASISQHIVVTQALLPSLVPYPLACYATLQSSLENSQPCSKAPPDIGRHCPYFVEIRNLRI